MLKKKEKTKITNEIQFTYFKLLFGNVVGGNELLNEIGQTCTQIGQCKCGSRNGMTLLSDHSSTLRFQSRKFCLHSKVLLPKIPYRSPKNKTKIKINSHIYSVSYRKQPKFNSGDANLLCSEIRTKCRHSSCNRSTS